MIEIESKVRLSDPDLIRKQLLDLGAQRGYSLDITDTYYNSPNIERDFARWDETLRLRYAIEREPTNNDIILETTDLTYKGPKMDQTIKTRPEIKVDLVDPENIHQLLTRIGFETKIVLKKHRELYEIVREDHLLQIMLDQVESLPDIYLEIELMIEHEDQITNAKESIVKFMGELGFQEHDTILKSYLELVKEYQKSG